MRISDWSSDVCSSDLAKASRRELTRAGTYAKRFAAKEACAKALGTGFRAGVFFRDMGVVNDPSGRPTLRLTGGAADRLTAITPPGHKAVVHLTLTDDHPWAMAVVMIEALPEQTWKKKSDRKSVGAGKRVSVSVEIGG